MLVSVGHGPEGGAAIWNSPAFGLIGIGFYLALSIAGAAIVGNLLDRKLGTDPVLTLAFLAGGLLIGFAGAWRQLRRLTERSAAAGGGRGR